jgi:hypothetical protein
VPGSRIDFATTGVGVGIKDGLPKPSTELALEGGDVNLLAANLNHSIGAAENLQARLCYARAVAGPPRSRGPRLINELGSRDTRNPGKQ